MARSTASSSGGGARRLALVAVLVAATWFAVQGGEYSTVDLVRQRTREQALRTSIDSLRRQVDSLKALQRALQSDPVVQERIAREMYGLVRGEKEIVYRFIDTVAGKP